MSEQEEQPAIQISATQIEGWRLCKRKWAFRKIDRLESPQNAYAALGEEMHKHRENWLLHGTPPPSDSRAGRLALVGLEHLPPPGLAQVETQVDCRYRLPDGEHAGKIIHATGRIDFFVPNNPDEPHRVWGTPGVPVVGDHKSSSDERWMKTPEQLVGGDPQGAIYSAEAIRRTGAQNVQLHWAYAIKSSTPRAHQVKVLMSRGQVQDQFGRVIDDAKSMLTVLGQDGIKAVDLEPNVHACEAFGGCPYREVCPISNQEKIGALMAQGALSDALAAALGGAASNSGGIPLPLAGVLGNGNGNGHAAAPPAAAPPAAPAMAAAGNGLGALTGLLGMSAPVVNPAAALIGGGTPLAGIIPTATPPISGTLPPAAAPAAAQSPGTSPMAVLNLLKGTPTPAAAAAAAAVPPPAAPPAAAAPNAAAAAAALSGIFARAGVTAPAPAAAPAPAPAPANTQQTVQLNPHPVHFGLAARFLVAGRQPPADAAPEVLGAYQMFAGDTAAAQQFLDALAAQQQAAASAAANVVAAPPTNWQPVAEAIALEAQQARVSAITLAQGVTPPDAPVSNDAVAEAEEKKKAGRPKGSTKAAAAALPDTSGALLVQMTRIADALEFFMAKAKGG